MQPPQPPPLRRFRRRGLGLIAVLVLAAAIAAVVFLRTRPAATPLPTIPPGISSRVQIALYYPATLPAGLSVDRSSFQVPQRDVVVFVVQSARGRIAVSEQARPSAATFDMNNFYNTKVSNSTQFLTSAGQGTVGQLADGRQFGSLLAPQTWIIVTAPAQVDPSELQAILNAMRPLAS
jgi:hypothetical protein